MIYSNPEFFVLLALTLAGFLYFRSYKIRFYLLLGSSIAFYLWASVFDTFIFLSVVAVSWVATALAREYPRHKKSFLFAGIAVMTLHLFFWKYFPWISRNIQVVFPGFLDGKEVVLPLPVGISFFTLQGIAYMVDYGRGQAKFIKASQYVLFKSFFPQLVAGPIVRSPQLLPQLEKLDSPKLVDINMGISLFALGFFKKLFIADRVSPFVDEVFRGPLEFGRGTLILAVLGYTVQIWADFSGYTDMGRGVARLFGIRLPENFLSPYLARTPSEFWRRWHITLSQWIRDYIYIPLGGSKGGRTRALVVAVVTMAISGLWHGAAWTFLLWGLYHGVLLVAERLCKGNRVLAKSWGRVPERARNVSLAVTMLVFTVFGWLIFRVQGVDLLKRYLLGIFYNVGPSVPLESPSQIYKGLVACAFIQVLLYFSFENQRWVYIEKARKAVARLKNENRLGYALGMLVGAAMVLTLFLRHSGQSKAFIYFQF